MTSPTVPLLPLHEPGPPAERALTGIRVVDFSHYLAGPICTMFLADLGAEVIKIEKPNGGDDFRRIGPQLGGQGAPFLWANRNKLGLTLDLACEAGRQVAHDLIAGADIVVENFTPGVMERFGLDYKSLAPSHPRLIYCSVSAFRRDGRFATRAGFDPIAQAESGFMSMNGDPDDVGMRTGPSIMDISTAMMACNAVLAALAARERLGKGQQVEVSLYETAALMTGFHAMNYLATGNMPTRFGNTSPDTAPMGVFRTADGEVYLACASDRLFQRFATELIDRPDLASDPDFATLSSRVRNRDRLIVEIESALMTASSAEWAERMEAAGIPAGMVRNLAEVAASAEFRDSGIATRIAHPTQGTVPNIASPLRLHMTPVVDPVAAPELGQHTEQILTKVLGYEPGQIAARTAAGAFGPGADNPGRPEASDGRVAGAKLR